MSDDRRLEHTLLSTDDAMVWAEEFCRIFKGWTIVPQANATVPGIPTPTGIVDEGGMVAWFASAMQTAVSQYERRKLHEKGELTEAEQFVKTWDEEHPADSEEDLEDALTLEEQFKEGFDEGRRPEV